MESRGVSILFFIGGIFFIMASILMGEAKAGLFFVFPFIYGTGFFMLIGVLLIFISMILFIFSFPSQGDLEYEGMEHKIEEKKGGLILIGPIPIIVSNDKKLTLIFILLSLIFIFIFLAFLFIKI